MQQYDTEIKGLAAELFDGELVIANYVSGFYYSIAETGAQIWQALRAGHDAPAIVAWLSRHYPAEAAAIERFVPEFIAELDREGIIVAREGSIAPAAWPALTATTCIAPAIERFEDLRDLLLIDPVHDVIETGWPHRAEPHEQ